MDHDRVLTQIIEFAQSADAVRAVVLTGSLARDASLSDDYSDLDIELFVTDPALFLENRSWYREFGTVLVVEELDNPGWVPTRLVYYEGGKIDFAVRTLPLSRPCGYDREYRVLVDKEGISSMLRPEERKGELPSASRFDEGVQDYYAGALMWATMLARGDLLAAKCREEDCIDELLSMIEWDHRARYGASYDCWYRGKNMHRWMDGDVVARLPSCFWSLDRETGAAAIGASMALYGDLASRTATALGYGVRDGTPVVLEVKRILSALPLSPR